MTRAKAKKQIRKRILNLIINSNSQHKTAQNNTTSPTYKDSLAPTRSSRMETLAPTKQRASFPRPPAPGTGENFLDLAGPKGGQRSNEGKPSQTLAGVMGDGDRAEGGKPLLGAENWP